MKLPSLRLPLAGRVFIVCAGLSISVSLIGSALLHNGASHSLRREVRERLMSVASTAALQIDPDLHSQVRTLADESSEPYLKLKKVLQDIRKANPCIRYIYTMRKTTKHNVWQFVVDAETDPENVSHVGDEYDVSEYPEMQKAFLGPAADWEPAEDKWGTWLSGYAPIKDSTGRAEAIIGLDMSLATLRVEESMLRLAAVRNILMALVAAMILSLAVTRALLVPVHVFTHAAERIRAGDLDFQVPVSRADEIGRFAGVFNHMIAGLKTSRDRLMEQTTRDFLTGLFNHRYFHERLTSEIARAERFGHPLCLLILDIDRFKSINDALGHPVGDSILRQVGDLLQETTRSIDVAARYGGDEFTVILPETDLDSGMVAGERMRRAIEGHEFRAVPMERLLAEDSASEDPPPIGLTVTIGAAAYPVHHTTRDGLIMAADIALCRAKHVARNDVCSYDASIGEKANVDPLELYQVLRDPNAAAVRSLAAAVDAKDRYTHGHSERVTSYALALAEGLALPPELLDALRVAGLLHDLGKIGVPDEILNKPGSLTREEREAVERHPSVGGDILRRAPQLDTIIPAVLFHHERWDGAGYPDGLSGNAIPLAARILAVADAFDAMTSDRPYRKAMSLEAALIELKANAGKQFDPALVDVFIQRVPDAQDEAA